MGKESLSQEEWSAALENAINTRRAHKATQPLSESAQVLAAAGQMVPTLSVETIPGFAGIIKGKFIQHPQQPIQK